MKIDLERREAWFLLSLLVQRPYIEVAPLVEKIEAQLVTDCARCAGSETCRAGHYGAYLCEPKCLYRQ